MKKSVCKLMFLVVFTLMFSGKLIAGNVTYQDGEKESMRSLSFLVDYPCTSSRMNYPLKSMIDESCNQNSTFKLYNKVDDFSAGFNQNNNFKQTIN